VEPKRARQVPADVRSRQKSGGPIGGTGNYLLYKEKPAIPPDELRSFGGADIHNILEGENEIRQATAGEGSIGLGFITLLPLPAKDPLVRPAKGE